MKKKTFIIAIAIALSLALVALIVYLTISFRTYELNTNMSSLEKKDKEFIESLKGKGLFSCKSRLLSHFALDSFIGKAFVEIKLPGRIVVSIAYNEPVLVVSDSTEKYAMCTKANYLRPYEDMDDTEDPVLITSSEYLHKLVENGIDENLWLIGVYNENLDILSTLIRAQDYVYNPSEEFGTWRFITDRASLSVQEPIGLTKLQVALSKVMESDVDFGYFNLYNDALVLEASEE